MPSSKFIELLPDTEISHSRRISAEDVRLEDVLAAQAQTQSDSQSHHTRSRSSSSTNSSSTASSPTNSVSASHGFHMFGHARKRSSQVSEKDLREAYVAHQQQQQQQHATSPLGEKTTTTTTEPTTKSRLRRFTLNAGSKS